MADESTPAPASRSSDKFLFTACFIALVATSFAFIIRVMLMDKWQIEFNLSETQKGEIFGAGLWPFGLSIVLFSLVIDRIGYRASMIVAFLCHLASAILLMTAAKEAGYWMLYVGSILNGFAAGVVEAVINPAVASMYPRRKTTMLTMLHAGWPGGFVLGGIALLAIGGHLPWQVKVGIILIPTLVYGIMLLWCKFPVSERVAAGIPYRDMLREAGAIGWLIVVYMVCMEVNRVVSASFAALPAPWLSGNLVDTTFFDLPSVAMLVVMGVLVLAYLGYTKTAGRPMYIFLLLVMILLAITELGTDTWIKELMGPAMEKVGLNAGLVLVYTATIMMVLRFCIAPIEKLLKPLGVLFVSALFAAAGLYLLAQAEGAMILVWATVYGAGQCFFWPVTLGLVSERFPRGGALTLNAIAGVGMLGVGILGSQLLGFWQDTRIDRDLAPDKVAHERFMDPNPRTSIFGSYQALAGGKVNAIEDKLTLYEYKVARVRDRVAGLMTEPDRKAFLDGLALAGKLDDPVAAKTLSKEQVTAAKAARQKLAKAVSETLPTDAFAEELAADKLYRTLVRNAVDHMKPQEPKKPGLDAPEADVVAYVEAKTEYGKRKAEYDEAVQSYESRLVFLEWKGMLLGPEDAADLADARRAKKVLDKVRRDAKRNAMQKVAVLPLIMAACYLGLIVYFKSKGGYRAVDLDAEGREAGEHPVSDREAVADAEKAPSE